MSVGCGVECLGIGGLLATRAPLLDESPRVAICFLNVLELVQSELFVEAPKFFHAPLYLLNRHDPEIGYFLDGYSARFWVVLELSREPIVDARTGDTA